MILNIRGTHGAGKSQIMLDLLRNYRNEYSPRYLPEQPKRPIAYTLRIPKINKTVYLLGPYETQCGGCDAIQPYDRIWPLVEQFARQGHVLFEGALVSSSVGEIGRAMAARKDCVIAFLDTPVEECLARIQRRRLTKGDTRPLNPKNTVTKYEGIERSKPKFAALGVRCVTLHYQNAYQEVLELLK